MTIRSGHRDEIGPHTFDRRSDYTRDSSGITCIATVNDQRAANHLAYTVIVLIVGTALLLIERPALDLTPKGAPGA